MDYPALGSSEHLSDLQPRSRSRFPGFVLTVLCCAAAHAANHRDFSAMYDVGPASVVDATHVSVTLSLRLQNHSGRPLSHAALAMKELMMPGGRGRVVASDVSVEDRGTAKTSGIVIVSANEYRRWQRGGQPLLVLRVHDSNGRDIDRAIELLRLPGVGALR